MGMEIVRSVYSGGGLVQNVGCTGWIGYANPHSAVAVGPSTMEGPGYCDVHITL